VLCYINWNHSVPGGYWNCKVPSGKLMVQEFKPTSLEWVAQVKFARHNLFRMESQPSHIQRSSQAPRDACANWSLFVDGPSSEMSGRIGVSQYPGVLGSQCLRTHHEIACRIDGKCRSKVLAERIRAAGHLPAPKYLSHRIQFHMLAVVWFRR